MNKLWQNLSYPSLRIRNVAVLSLVLGALCLFFASYLATVHQLPEGVNSVFMRHIGPIFLVLGGFSLGTYWFAPKTSSLLAINASHRLTKPDLLLLLLPITPVVQYLLSNREILSDADFAIILLLFLTICGLLVLVLPHILYALISEHVLRVALLIWTFMLTNMAVLSSQLHWFGQGDLKIQLSIALILFVVILSLYVSSHRSLVYFLILAYFVSNSIARWPPPTTSNPSQVTQSQHPLIQALQSRQPEHTPNIYLLVYDSYAHNETMLQYGIDNSQHEDYLAQQGFKLYSETYSIGGHSVASISTLLNASTDFYGNSRSGASGHGVVQQILSQDHYSNHGIFPSDFFFQGIGSGYDSSFPKSKPASLVLIDGILLGEFRFDIGFDRQTGEEFTQEKLAFFQNPPASPFFHYSHSYSPGHSQNSGACLPDEKQRYAQSVEQANQEMRSDLEIILANDPGAIIVVAGDHGPYLSKNCYSTSEGGYNLHEITRYDIQDRFGTFLAIRWPDADYAIFDQIIVLQDLFPSIFAYLYQDPSLLQNRIPPVILYEPSLISGAFVDDGIIQGGVNDGEPLFINP